jgi:hypothetical protein
MGVGLDELIQDRHDVPIRVLDGVKAHLMVALDQSRQVGRGELGEHGRAEKWSRVEAVIRAEGEAIQAPVFSIAFGLRQCRGHHRLGQKRKASLSRRYGLIFPSIL